MIDLDQLPDLLAWPDNATATPEAVAFMERHGVTPFQLLRRHVKGQWDVDAVAMELNRKWAAEGAIVLGEFHYGPERDRVWVTSQRGHKSVRISTPANLP